MIAYVDLTILESWSRQTIIYVVFGSLMLFLFYRNKASTFPVVNGYFLDLIGNRAYQEYDQNAISLVSEGIAKYQAPVQVLTPKGPRIILPASYTNWAKSCKDLDHQAIVHEDFFADLPGMEGMRMVTDPKRLVIDLVRTKLSQNSATIGPMNLELADILSETWKNSPDWHCLDWSMDTITLVSRVAAVIFVGKDLARNPDWQNLTITYTLNVFGAVTALYRWPRFMRGMISHFLTESRTCIAQVNKVRTLVTTIIEQRSLDDLEAAHQDDAASRHEDCIAWLSDLGKHEKFDMGAAQLALAISALHTTSEALRTVLLDLCKNPDLIDPIRREIKSCLNDGVNLAALSKMELLDSVMKESQRFQSASGIERKVMKDTTLPNGVKLPQGSNIAIDASEMWSAEVHDNPHQFDGYRFWRMRQAGKLAACSFVSSTREHNTFGAGRAICPGRFFVANEIKLILAHVLWKYDIRLKAGYSPKLVRSGFYAMSDLQAQVEVPRRIVNDDLLL